MTTLENAMMLFATLFSGGMMSALAWGVNLRRHRTAAERLRAVQQKALTEQRKLRSVSSAIASDYCAGADHLVLRGSMHWTADGEWRCKECAPIDESEELRAEIEAAAEALDDGDEVNAAAVIPIITSAPARRFETIAEAKMEQRKLGGGTIRVVRMTYGDEYEVTPFLGPGEYRDNNATALAYGEIGDSEWSATRTSGRTHERYRSRRYRKTGDDRRRSMARSSQADGKHMRALFKRLRACGLVIEKNRGACRICDADGKYLVTTSSSPKNEHTAWTRT